MDVSLSDPSSMSITLNFRKVGVNMVFGSGKHEIALWAAKLRRCHQGDFYKTLQAPMVCGEQACEPSKKKESD